MGTCPLGKAHPQVRSVGEEGSQGVVRGVWEQASHPRV